ncbi:MAG: ATP-binding protein [Deltaproteobacteria bacterium]|jgi:transitional endoplasmic reticulum ATPase|nr:ATP-binding protein [Deltaproteobacteria bacterium]MBK9645339.1 ATP-binding protein [Deltaproteobacteria bacterium]MCK6513532.1 ATP-binding protein [Myxococcota bacterium]
MKREPQLPTWARELRERYLAGEASMFLLHGNVRDLHPWEDRDGKIQYVPLRAFLEAFLSRSKEIVAWYNVSEGVEVPTKEMEGRLNRCLSGGVTLAELPKGPGEVLPHLEEVITDTRHSAAVVLDYAETIAPSGDLSFMSELDKRALVSLQRWSSDPALLASDNLVILVTEQLLELHRKVLASPQLAHVAVPLPNEEERERFIRAQDLAGIDLQMSEHDLARVTAGLTLLQIRGLFRVAREGGQAISFKAVSRRKKSIIEQECHGLVEFVDPSHDFSHVGGMDGVKEELMRIATAIRKGHTNRVPMGVIFVGPMGTGKTFLAEAFAGESGLTCLKLKNFRDKWVGSTEANLEKILQVVDGLGYVLLILDEADRSIGNQGGETDGGTGSRVIARLKEFMSDTSHRGRVVIVMMTNRPDKLDTDLKRPGRFDLKIPFFFPEHEDERLKVMQAQVRKNKLTLAPDVDLAAAAARIPGYSAAEIEAVLLASAGIANGEDREVVSAADLDAAVTDVIPSRDTRMLEFMELLAVFESSTKRMLPARHQGLDTEQVQARLDALRSLLGGRAA